MPLKKDADGQRRVEIEFIVSGSPEQVWQAIATGEGNAAWFTKAEIEPRAGGAIRFEFAPGVSTTGEVTAYEPPNRIAYVESDWMDGAPPVATEITITSRTGDQCLVRMVHSLFASTDDWDDQLEGFEKGWPGFFEVLRIYLHHFAGLNAAPFQVLSKVNEAPLPVWTRLLDRLGLTAPNTGEWRETADPPQRLRVVVEQHRQDQVIRTLHLRVEEPVRGTILLGIYAAAGTTNVSVSGFVYGDDASSEAAASETRWREWLLGTFPPASPNV